MIRASRVALLLAAAVAMGLSPAAAKAAQRAGSPGYCPDGNGVTVIVDFQELGGTTIVRCAPGDQPTGLAALKNAGIGVTGTQRWGEGFICRIEGKPGPESEACIDTPPASAYWSYWYAPDRGAWKYSEWGVLNRKPPLGSFEGWSFAKNKTSTTNPPPRIAPRRPAAPPAPPPPANPPPANPAPPAPGGSGGTGPVPGAATAAPTAGAPGVASTAPNPPSTPPSTPASSAADSSSSTAPVSGSADGVNWTGEIDPTAAQSPPSSPVGLLIGTGIVLLLGAAAGSVAVRRKRSAGRGGP